MGIDRLFRVSCDFCKCVGLCYDNEPDAVKQAKESRKAIRLIHVSFYGNEVWACAECLESNSEAKEWAAMPKRQ